LIEIEGYLKSIKEDAEWIKIESEADLPKETGNYWVMKKYYSYPIIEIKYANDTDHWINQFTHYQPIQKPKPPVF